MKPKLVFFQWDHKGLPQFLQLHMQLHYKCLSRFFEVLVINTDCDYQEVCEKFQPDVTLFESGYKTQKSKKIQIRNTNSHPEVPKLGLHNGDGWCDCRSGFLSDMEKWGIETFFTISTTTAEHTPELAEHFFAWPNFIDTDIYWDYKQPKIIPVMFSGCINPLYPWREKTHSIISSCYPSLIFPHQGYESHSPVMIHGKEYAMTINSSWFVPSCGTVARELVRKHLEIPGSKSCLITERSPVLEAAGFEDMTNCVFADEKDVLDKMDFLFSNKERLAELIYNGYNLVHKNHTMKQRDQIYQWFDLQKKLQPHQKIIQEGPFGKLKLIDKLSQEQTLHISGKGKHLECLRLGDEFLKKGEYDQAILLYKECEQMIPWMSEPQLKLTRAYLRKGDPGEALKCILKPLQASLGSYEARDPDPLEWAYFLVALLCNGQLSTAGIRKEQFPGLFHPVLKKVHEVLDFLNETRPMRKSLGEEKIRKSMHQVEPNYKAWDEDLYIMLNACGQSVYAERLKSLKMESVGPPKENRIGKWWHRWIQKIRMKGIYSLNLLFSGLRIPNRRKGLPSISLEDFIIRFAKIFRVEKFRKFFNH